MRSYALAGVILAAGESSRMGSQKALLEYGGQSFLAGAIQLLQSVCDFVLVVTGANSGLLEPVIYEQAAFLTRNPKPELGQFSSLRVGLQAVLDRGRDTACVTLVDRPPALPTTVLKLQEAFQQSSSQTVWAVVPEFGGKHGHPVIFGRAMIEAFLRAEVTANAREMEHEHQSRILYVSVDDARVTMNINTPEDYSALLQSRS
ncbi:MAG: nucleotidyltransferase family protein [Acidobacteria bacterium]|nr:nucleotidyltransferase family protein [Acidobacteriota bacterium]